jgi:O-antigen/teichoic acid export membrane protein
MSFFRNAVSLMATSIVVTPIGLLTTVLLTRTLSPADFGTYSVLISFTTITTLLSQLGWPSATIYRTRRLGVPAATAATAGLVGMAATSTIAVGLCLQLDDWIAARFLHSAPVVLIRYVLPIVPALVFARWFIGLARALERFDLENAYRFAVVSGTLAVLSFVLLVRQGGLAEALLGAAAVNGIASAGLGVAVLAQTGIALELRLGELVASVRYGMKTYAQTIATQLHEQIDIFMLAALAIAREEIAYYAVAVGIVNRLKIVPDAIATALFPRAASLDHAEAADVASRATRHAALWVALTTIAIAVVAPVVVPFIFGEPYLATVPPLFVLLPAMMGMTLATILSRFFMAFDRQTITVAIQATATAANVVLNFVLIPRFGTMGAASASLVSYMFTATCMTWAFRRQTGLPLRALIVLGGEDVATYRARLTGLRARLGR